MDDLPQFCRIQIVRYGQGRRQRDAGDSITRTIKAPLEFTRDHGRAGKLISEGLIIRDKVLSNAAIE